MANSGMVLAIRRLRRAGADASQDLLVFPGGTAEANKTVAEKHSLVWRERTGLSGWLPSTVTTSPFGMVGPDDWWDHAN